ncbi:MAG TPA: MBL fold metallo-hydrolase [Oxalicibacterium sp.]|jgi:glyoxylase-like metal-dependent hydrolase (beta-lactamase superfamily II)|nr:MBL fold metallo-hydrolase [Oxalicibacterium sp.]
MNPLEAQLDYPFGDAVPDNGRLLEVAPGIQWLRMTLPFALNHINLWLLEDERQTEGSIERGWTIVDCGVSNETTRAAWEQIFATQLGGKPVLRVIATHCHPDHVGLADWICAHWQAPLWMSAAEYGFARMMSAGLPGADGTAMFPFFQKHGLRDPAMVAELEGRRSYYPTMVPSMPTSYVRMQDNDLVRIGRHDWRVITGFGHSPEHVSLVCDALNVMISGDMVLPRISTNVSVFAIEPESNPVQQYLDSLRKFRDLPETMLLLPSHGKPFRGLHTRIAQLFDHHAARLQEVLEACATPQSAADIVPIMFKRQLDSHQLTFAMGEALAHLHKLWIDGHLKRISEADGIRFIRIQETGS